MIISINCWAQKPNKHNFRYALPTLKNDQSFQVNKSNNLNSNIVFLPWKQIDGSFGLLPVIVMENKHDIHNDTPTEYNEFHNILEKRLKLLREILEFHQAIKQAKSDLQKLKQERERVVKKMNLIKTILLKKNKMQLNRLE